MLHPKTWLRFVELDPFANAWKRQNLTDAELRDLLLSILAAPDGPPVVAGTGGLRKIRFAPASRRVGKSGAMRVYYTHFPAHGIVVLIAMHGKNEKEAITEAEKRVIRKRIEEIDRYLQNG